MRSTLLIGVALVLLTGTGVDAQGTRGIASGTRPTRFVIRNAMVIVGNGTPASGPYDIVVEGNTITDVVSLDPVAVRDGRARRPAADAEIDATGKYVLPGLINLHGHVQDERGGVAQSLDYQLKLWLASGITTVRDVGSTTASTIALRGRSAAGTVAAPRIVVYANFNDGGDGVDSRGIRSPEQARARVQALKAAGADGISWWASTATS
jgi:cytosine/adenosine deaminase-related metal-dependent hydrolase